MTFVKYISFFILLHLFFFIIAGCKPKESKTEYYILPFHQVIEKTDVVYHGLQYLCVDSTAEPRIIRAGFNYLNGHFESHISFVYGLASISLFYATGENKYLKIAKETATLLDSLLPENGLVPEYFLNKNKDTASVIYTGTYGLANILCFVCVLSEIDNSYKPLCKKLADGLIKYGINPVNKFAWFQIYAIDGKPYKSPDYDYESQLGSFSCAVAQSLLLTYKELPSEQKYLDVSLQILKNIWKLRNPETNLVPEAWDVYNNKKATKIYPDKYFRYDDMGGVYVRTLVLAYQISKDPEILEILSEYVKALLTYVWDKEIGGGGFRYRTDLDGDGPPSLETMYGLFIASLIEASQYLDLDTKNKVISECKEHAKNVYLTDYGVKNYMVPHSISKGGVYTSNTNDSQLAYAVIQFPLGMSLLTQMTDDYSYIYRTNKIIKTLLERHREGDNIKSPMGYVNIKETQPPYGFEKDYSNPSWCFQIMYLPSYMLFSGIVPNNKVKIDWLFDNAPCVFGLASGMPYWDLQKVNFNLKEKKLVLNEVISEVGGGINFEMLGFNKINKVLCDDQEYSSFEKNKIKTKSGKHSYIIYFD